MTHEQERTNASPWCEWTDSDILEVQDETFFRKHFGMKRQTNDITEKISRVPVQSFFLSFLDPSEYKVSALTRNAKST